MRMRERKNDRVGGKFRGGGREGGVVLDAHSNRPRHANNGGNARSNIQSISRAFSNKAQNGSEIHKKKKFRKIFTLYAFSIFKLIIVEIFY